MNYRKATYKDINSISSLVTNLLGTCNLESDKSILESNIEEISKILKVAKEDVAIALESSQPVESIEGSMTQDSGDKSLSLLERISTGKDEQEMVTNKIVLKQLLDGLEDSDKEVILLRYYKEKTQAQIAKILGISQVQVSRIEKKVLQKMRYKLLGNAS